jgi:uncharacterized protein (DUF362 family)
MNQFNRNITRRSILKATLACMAIRGIDTPFSSAQGVYDLVVVSGDPTSATKKAIEAMGGISRFVKKGARVVLKPNMSFARTPEIGANTTPQVVATVAKLCIDAGAERVMVLDHTLQRPELCLERSGIQEACKGIKNVYVLPLQEKKFYQEIKVPQGKILEKVEVMKDVLNSDVLINLPTAKSHSTTGVSLGIKGLMGLIWDRESFHSRFNINQALADLLTVIKPNLTILDATRALVSGGPGGPGEVHKPNLIIAGIDPVAVDSFGVTVAPWYGKNFKGRQVEHLLVAFQRGLGKIDIDQLRILKEKA